MKCFRGTLEHFVQHKPSYKGRGKLDEPMRKRFTTSACSAIIMKNQEPNKVQAVKKLQQDLGSIPLHCFGCHSKCSPDFCKTVQKNNEQPQQQQTQHQQEGNNGGLATSTSQDITDDTINNTGIKYCNCTSTTISLIPRYHH